MNLLKATSIYTIVKLINQAIPFLLLPLFTQYLTPYDYGKVAFFNTILSFIVIIISLGLPSIIGADFIKKSKEEFISLVSNLIVILFCMLLILISIFYLFEPILNIYIKFDYVWIYVIIIIAYYRSIMNIYFIILRFKDKILKFSFFEISHVLLNMVSSFALIIILHMQWKGRAWGIAISSIFLGIISFYYLYIEYFKKKYISIFSIKSSLKFSLPIIPHHIAMWIRGGFDIIIITSILGSKKAGIYSTAFQLSSIIGLLASSFISAFTPYLYKKLYSGSNKEKREIVLITYTYFLSILFIALLLGILYQVLIPAFLNKKYIEVIDIIFILTFANAFLGMYYIISTYIFYEKKTYELSKLTIKISLLHMTISYILTSQFGIRGAAVAIFITYLLSFILVFKLSNRIYPMPWKIKIKKENEL